VFLLYVNNLAPVLGNAGNVIVSEGLTATNSGTWRDDGADDVRLTASIGAVAQNSDGTWTWSLIRATALVAAN
jgi:hypothetical protein